MRSLIGLTVGVAATAALFLVAAAPSFGAASAERYIVEFSPGDSEAGKNALRRRGSEIVLGLGPQNAVAARIPDEALHGLENSPSIELIEPDARRYPMAQTVPYGIPMVQADLVSPAGQSAANRVVGIIDSGYSIAHEDLADERVTGTNDPGTGNWFEDACGHGSHVAGTISALSNDLGVVGVMPGVSLHIVKVFGDNCRWAYASSLVAALNAQREAGANVVNMSLGGSSSSEFERSAFADAYEEGMLLVAAAGNGGSTIRSYPASYESVISVAAIDENKAHAPFSQRNAAVELAAPGVDVLSTVPWLNTRTLTAGDTTWTGGEIEGAAATDGTTGPLVDGGLCDASGEWAGAVVLCRRGEITFAEKVANVGAGGGVAAVIYNNVAGGFSGTLNGTGAIPAIALSDSDGAAALGQLGTPGTVVNRFEKPGSGYEAWNGTSMAAPHVAGVAAAVWSCQPGWSNTRIRAALTSTAQDLGPSGRDETYGFGLVQARAALDELLARTRSVGVGNQGTRCR